MNNYEDLEEYLLLNAVYANKKYISDSIMLISKDIIKHNKVLYHFQNNPKNFFKPDLYPLKKGELWVLPSTVVLAPYGRFEFIYDDDYHFDYRFIKMFEEHFVGDIEYRIVFSDYDDVKNAPILQLFYQDKFVALIPAINVNKYRKDK